MKKKKNKKPATENKGPTDPFAIAPASGALVSEVRVERDAAGRIVRILDDGRRPRPNPLDDPLNALDSDPEDEEDEDGDGDARGADGGDGWGGINDDNDDDDDDDDDDHDDEGKRIVRQLEAQANRPVERRARTQSRREREWLESLVRRHGDDFGAMARDRALNPMQQTEADIARRIRKSRAEAA